MPARTVKGAEFTIVVGDKRITVKHIYSKGKRCRVIAPAGVKIESRDCKSNFEPQNKSESRADD